MIDPIIDIKSWSIIREMFDICGNKKDSIKCAIIAQKKTIESIKVLSTKKRYLFFPIKLSSYDKHLKEQESILFRLEILDDQYKNHFSLKDIAKMN